MAYVRTPEEDDFLHSVKCDSAYFKQALGIKSEKTSELHAMCPFCGNKNGFQFGQSKQRSGEYFYHCHNCGQNGDTFTALNLLRQMSMRDVFKKVRADFGGKTPPQVVSVPKPVPKHPPAVPKEAWAVPWVDLSELRYFLGRGTC